MENENNEHEQLPDEWDTHKFGGVDSAGTVFCADDCEACRFEKAVAVVKRMEEQQ